MNNNPPTPPTCIAPLPYVYDEDDSRCVVILTTVSEFCGHKFPEPETEENTDPTTGEITTVIKNEQEILDAKKSYWARLWQTIRFVSALTCWSDSIDDTFIMQCRTQTYYAAQVNTCTRNCCRCDEDDIVIDLAYTPLDEDMPFVEGNINVVIDGKVKSYQISYEYLNEHYDKFTGKLHILRDDFPEALLAKGSCCCLCERKLTITLRYNAGFFGIPAGLLPMICPLFAKIDDSKTSINDCASAMTQVAGLLKSKKVGNIKYEWSDKDSEPSKTQALYTELYNLANVAEVFSISRCDVVLGEESAGDVI